MNQERSHTLPTPVKVSIRPVEPVLLEVDGEPIRPAELVLSDARDVRSVGKAPRDVGGLARVAEPIRVVQEPGSVDMVQVTIYYQT